MKSESPCCELDPCPGSDPPPLPFRPAQLALRAGNEKEEGETADTVGCCSLRVEHIALHPQLDGEENVVEFDFLGKDCIRYYNKVPVTRRVRRQHLANVSSTPFQRCVWVRAGSCSCCKRRVDRWCVNVGKAKGFSGEAFLGCEELMVYNRSAVVSVCRCLFGRPHTSTATVKKHVW